ncbi:elongation factor P maturation arginine rhamnosyltransferase EarP [Aquariibacter lacus]|uniref:elongation factor P maturation arginine rhamnosyltransferase EarP n=1 Tax=Aquariibacter lacus TaxID=2801332 RepID=UPI003307BA2C
MPPPLPASPAPGPRWDLFCRVIDNHGDLGVCWRLATRLAALGAQVRLWVDDARALAWMAPGGCPGVRVLPWREPQAAEAPGEVVVEAFGCDPPAGFVAAMAARLAAAGQHAPGAVPARAADAGTDPLPSKPAPLWLNLEYLSAETYVERSHGLRSPQASGPGAGLDKWFFYPGFTPATGGLMRGPLPADPGTGFDPAAVRAEASDGAARPGVPAISLFGYPQAALPAQLAAWAGGPQPLDLLLTPGHATEQAAAWLGRPLAPGEAVDRGALRLIALPWLSQAGFDRLLAACALNLVRGEDSLARALWAGQPMLWQLYPQDEDAHAVKLQAFLDRVLLPGATPQLAQALRAAFARWNGLADPAVPALLGLGPGEPGHAAWAAQAEALRARLQARVDTDGDLAQTLWRAAHGPAGQALG